MPGDKLEKTCQNCRHAKEPCCSCVYKSHWEPLDGSLKNTTNLKKDCQNCKHTDIPISEGPCSSCDYDNHWQPLENFTERRDHMNIAITDPRKILDELGAHICKKKLQALPEQILKQRLELRQLRSTLGDLEKARALREAEITSEILAEINSDTLKPAFPNEASRNAERLRRMGADEEYQMILRQVKEAENAVNQAQDELYKLCDDFKALESSAKIIASEIALFTQVLPVIVQQQQPEEQAF